MDKNFIFIEENIEKRLSQIESTERSKRSGMTDVSPREKSAFGKILADKFFKQQGWATRTARENSSYDTLVSDGNNTYAVSIKFGRVFQIEKEKIEKLFCIDGVIPALLFISSDKKFMFFVPKDIKKVDINGKNTGARGAL